MEISEMSSTRVINYTTIRQEEIDLEKNRQRQSNIQTLEYMAATGMFARYLARGYKALNVGISRFVFFPLIMFFQAIELGLVVNQARLERQIQGSIKSATLAKLAVEAITFAATSAAIIGGMVAPALFVLATPALLVAGVGLKALYDLGTAAVLLVNSFRLPNGTELDKQRRSTERYDAFRKLVSGLANAAITLALVFVAPFATAISPFAATLALGIGGAVTGVAFAAMTKHRRSKVNVAALEDASLEVEEAHELEAPLMQTSTTATLHKKLEVVYGLPTPAVAVTVLPASTSSNVSYLGRRPAAAQMPTVSATSNADVTISSPHATAGGPRR
jgi:hypothetical protein